MSQERLRQRQGTAYRRRAGRRGSASSYRGGKDCEQSLAQQHEWRLPFARGAERERLEARVRELEVLEMSWKQMRGIFNTKGPV